MEGLSKEYSMDQLPTAPIGKQQIIDLNAGAILRKENKKTVTFCGVNPFLLLTFIMFFKCGLLGGWLYREYQVFDFGCQMLRVGTDYIYQGKMTRDSEEEEEEEEDYQERRKRSLELEEFIDRQGQPSGKQRPVIGGTRGALTTMVTMTNLQDLPSADSTPIRMKTIRQRVEEVNRVPVDSDSAEEPTIYISPIQSRNAPPIDDSFLATVQTTKPNKKKKGKGKGKGRKKSRSTPEPTTEMPVTKKKKGLGRKKQKMLEQMNNRLMTEQTKSPRHLMTSVGHTGPTPRPGKGSFLDGGVEPRGRGQANKGHIRNYPMNKATKRPKNGIKLSEETRLMWKMNEVNYTTHAMQAKTTEMTKEEKEHPSVDHPPARPQAKPDKKEKVTTDTPAPMHEFYSSRTRSKSKEHAGRTSTIPTPVVVALRPENKVREGAREDSTQVYQPVAVYYETIVEHPKKPLSSRLAQLERDYGHREGHQESDEDKEYYIPSPPRKVKHGYDRGMDSAIDAGLTEVDQKLMSTQKPRQIEDLEENDRFKDELRSFTSNALCVVRTIFDTWCGCQIITALPYLLGMCLARRNLFITHLICDILFLGCGFLFSVTLLVLSILLYVAVEGMSTAEFLQWLMFVFVVEAFLISYVIIVYICYQCTEKIILSRQNGCSKTVSTAEVV